MQHDNDCIFVSYDKLEFYYNFKDFFNLFNSEDKRVLLDRQTDGQTPKLNLEESIFSKVQIPKIFNLETCLQVHTYFTADELANLLFEDLTAKLC